jgi:SHS2 domain-containing protein
LVHTPDTDAQGGFRALEHTADRSIEAWGPNLRELFRAAAEGMFSESANCAQIASEQEWSIQVEADSLADLLHTWLSELLWISERDEAAVCRVEVESVQESPCRARGRAWGGAPPKDSPHTGAPVKAVTYHDLCVWRDKGMWRARLVFDV